MSSLYTHILAGAFTLGLAGCAQFANDGAQGERLADLQITDPNFSFATSRTVSLEVRVSEAAGPQIVEVADAEGRRLMQGAFLNDTTFDLKVPLGQAPVFKVRTGQGDQAVEQDVAIDADGRAVTSIR